MTKSNGRHYLLMLGKRGAILLLAGLLSLASVLYSFQPQTASAAQLTPRKVTIDSSVAGATTGYEFEFTWTNTVVLPVRSAIFQFCTTPLGTCTLPGDSSDMDVTSGSSITGSTGFPVTDNDFTKDTTGSNNCSDTGTAGTETMLCITRSQVGTSIGGTGVVTFAGIDNPTFTGTDTFETIYVRISLYSDAAYTTLIHDGTVAAAVTQQLETTGRVQERLEFCVAALDENDYDTGGSLGPPQDCGDFPTTTSVDLGVIDNGSIAISPVPFSVTNPANDSYGAAMVNTNAAGGVVIEYFPEAETNVSGGDTDQLRSFRVAPTDCADNSLVAVVTDQCFESADGVTPTLMSAGTENFGIFIPCIGAASVSQTVDNLADNQVAAYAGTDGTMIDATPDDCENDESTNTRFDFADTAAAGTATTITSSNSVVDNEWLKIVFAATASATTPTGQYSVTTTYIATPTF